MNKTILGVAMVVVFCITWWLVAGEAMQIAKQELTAAQQARRAVWQAKQALLGVGAGLLADVLLLVGVVAWQKITFKA